MTEQINYLKPETISTKYGNIRKSAMKVIMNDKNKRSRILYFGNITCFYLNR